MLPQESFRLSGYLALIALAGLTINAVWNVSGQTPLLP